MTWPGASTSSRKRLLPEVEGLRALAVVSVLLYHAKLGFSGGYIGVDVFFVVSGFLITRLLANERANTGQISLASFYARRVRRLLPAASLVLVSVVAASYFLLNPLRAHDTAVDAGWSAGFLANVHFAQVGTDYLASSAAPSLLQHWWSLAIEEQFYIVWPGVLAAAWALKRRVATTGAVVCVAVVGLSFALGLWLTDKNPVWAYFAPWARAWELAVGGLCVFLWQRRDSGLAGAVLGWAGVAAIATSALVFDQATAFPGVAALAPVLGTAAVILSIGAPGAPGRLLALPVAQWIGGRSYGIYLWHWPVLVLLQEHYDKTAPAWRVGALLLSVALAAATYVLLESPVRYLPTLTSSSVRSLALGATLVALVFGIAQWSATTTSDVKLSTGYVAPTLPTVPPTTVLSPTTSVVDSPSTTAAPDPLDLLNEKVATELQPLLAASALQELVPDNITPAISDQDNDTPIVWSDGCLAGRFDEEPGVCEYGDLTSDVTVALFGDSHVDQWFAAAEAAAIRNHWKLLVMSKSKCPIVDIDVVWDSGSSYKECHAWLPLAMERVLQTDVKVVVITQWRQHYRVRVNGGPHAVSDDEWRESLSKVISTLQQAEKKVLLLGDTPFASYSMNQCIAERPHTLTKCNLDRPGHTVQSAITLESELAAALGAEYYDTNDWFCANDVCPVVVGNVAVYMDAHHITNTYGAFLTPYLELLLQHVLAS